MATLNRKLVKMIVDRIDIVGRPANGERRFTMVKSADGLPEADLTEEGLFADLKKQIADGALTINEARVRLSKSPELANTNLIDPAPAAEDLGRTEAIEHMNALVRQASDLPLPLRKHLAEVCNYMGLSGPDTTTPDIPDYDPIMARLESFAGIMEKAITAWTTPPAQPAAAPLKKEEPAEATPEVISEVVPEPQFAPVELVKQFQVGREALDLALAKFEVFRKRLLVAAGKDPDGPLS